MFFTQYKGRCIMTTQQIEPQQEINPQQGQAAFALFGMLSGAWAAQVLQVGTELGIADVLKDGPKTITELAEATETHTPSLTRLMRALVALGVFAEQKPGVYSMTGLSWHLCRDYPGSLRNFILFFGIDWSWNIWNELPYAIKTGASAMRHAHGKSIWQHMDERPEDLHMLNAGIDEFSTLINPTILASYDFSAFRSLVDIGGGYGNFLKLLAERNPAFQGTLFERPPVIAEAKTVWEQSSVASQVTLVEGSFLTDELPAGLDAYFYKFVINDWGDEYVKQTLSACRRAIPPHGKLVIAEFVLAANPEPISTLMNVLTFLSFEGGQGRTEAEFRALFQETGFTLTQVIPTPSGLYILEGVPS